MRAAYISCPLSLAIVLKDCGAICIAFFIKMKAINHFLYFPFALLHYWVYFPTFSVYV
jgi:hypothetical protein